MAKPAEIQFILIRTGETEWDAQGRVSGAADIPLSEKGLLQASETVQALADVPLDVVIGAEDEASVVLMTRLAEASHAKVRKVPGLGEMRLGLWEGMRQCDLEEKYPTAYRQWCEDPAGVVVPDGETIGDAEDRIIGQVIRTLEKCKATNVALVLRPIANGIVRSWVDRKGTSSLWTSVNEGPTVDVRTLAREELRAWRERAEH
ncbi:MAG: histidine phosphatase family protein [Phycisphaerales bacterium]|nr:histidine phosphatase family protein [Phycisphaerales bacterium]